jgi:triosephosphate isomerase
MRTQIAAANWKMNLTLPEARTLLDGILPNVTHLGESRKAIFAVPACYLTMAQEKVANVPNVFAAAQNVYSKKLGAFTGELSVIMLKSLGIKYVIIGHSERREYFNENNQFLADKVKICLEEEIIPIFCCGEALPVREVEQQNSFVRRQLEESLFDLSGDEMRKIVIAYEPIWAIGTGKTATSDQAQEMQAYIRDLLSRQYGEDVANSIPILYGGSVKASNAKDIFGKPDVDGGLVGGSSLIADEFVQIINALK